MADPTTFFIGLAISAAFSVAAAFLAPRPRRPDEKLNLQLPTSTQGEPIPYFAGTVDLKGTIVWPRSASETPKEEIETGNASGKGKFGAASASSARTWLLTFAIKYGWGPIDRLEEIRVDDCVIWAGALDYDAADFPDGYVDLTTTKTGRVRFYWATPGQAADPILEAVTPNVPDWKNQCYVVFDQFDCGPQATIPNVTVRVRRKPQSPLSNPDLTILTGTLGSCDYLEANPVHILAEILTDATFGLGIPFTRLDADSWNAAAATLATEGRGLSLAVSSQADPKSLCENILYHLNAGIVRRGNKLVFKLLRQDYDPEAAPIVTTDHIADWSVEPGLPTQTLNHIAVEYSDVRRNYQADLFPIFDAGAVLGQLNTKRETIRLPYATQEGVAKLIAREKLQQLTVQHDAATLKIARAAGIALEWGDVLRIEYAPDGITTDRLWRIIEIEALANGFAAVKLVEEVAALAAAQPDDDDAGPPAGAAITGPLTDRLLELPWEWNRAEEIAMTHLAGRNQLIYTRFINLGGVTTDLAERWTDLGRFAVAGTLAADWSAATRFIDDTGFVVVPAADFTRFGRLGSILRHELFTNIRVAVIDDEIVALQIVEGEGDNYRLRGVIRGLWDTRRAAHAAGTPVFVCPTGLPPYSVPRRPNWGNGVTVFSKAIPYNQTQTGRIADFVTRQWTQYERAHRPYPAENLLVKGISDPFSPTYTADELLCLTWFARTRGAGFGSPSNEDEDTGSGGFFGLNAETEGHFRVRVFDATDTELIGFFDVPAGSIIEGGFFDGRWFYSLDPARLDPPNPDEMIVRVRSILGSWKSRKKDESTVTVTKV